MRVESGGGVTCSRIMEPADEDGSEPQSGARHWAQTPGTCPRLLPVHCSRVLPMTRAACQLVELPAGMST